jgi:PAS domain S-box-containing protein
MSFHKPCVLIVDDQPRNLDALESILEPLGCEFVRATTPDAALLALLQNEFAAIVLDIRMPEMSGIDLAKLIKQRRRSKHVPILFLTAHSVEESDLLQGYGVGAVDYLSKPINADILRSKVGVFVDLFTKTRALALLNETLKAEVGERERMQAALQVANQDLERRVQERTAALLRAHQGVRENEERLRMALSVSRSAAWEWDLSSGQLTWSTSPELLFGLPEGAMGPDLRLVRIAHPEDRPRIDDAVVTASDTGAYDVEYRLVRPDGSIVWVVERGRLLREAAESSRHVVGITRDVTGEKTAALERERLLKDARAARDEAERQSRMKDEFLASLSHELRTPMNVILGWLATLESGKPIKDVYSVLAVVRRNAELQAKLIDDLLDMNRLISGSLQLDLEPVDMAALLQATIQGLRPAADGKGVQILASVDSSTTQLLGDSRRLQQVLWNLVHNAVKFTPKGGRVEIHIHPVDGNLQILVQDNGRGISPEFLPHIFERFRQEDSPSIEGVAGLGLGLAITKQLVEMHGGTIQALSAGRGAGSRFVIRLPGARQGAPKKLEAGGISDECQASA